MPSMYTNHRWRLNDWKLGVFLSTWQIRGSWLREQYLGLVNCYLPDKLKEEQAVHSRKRWHKVFDWPHTSIRNHTWRTLLSISSVPLASSRSLGSLWQVNTGTKCSSTQEHQRCGHHSGKKHPGCAYSCLGCHCKGQLHKAEVTSCYQVGCVPAEGKRQRGEEGEKKERRAKRRRLDKRDEGFRENSIMNFFTPNIAL